jgi:hypothetical protein
MGSVGAGEECECEWERLEKDDTWKDNGRFITVHPLESADQCELACCYRQLGCAAYTYTPDHHTCKLWVELDGECHASPPSRMRSEERTDLSAPASLRAKAPCRSRRRGRGAAPTSGITSAKHRPASMRATRPCRSTTTSALDGLSLPAWRRSRWSTCSSAHWSCRSGDA